jgi:hypothetical protein
LTLRGCSARGGKVHDDIHNDPDFQKLYALANTNEKKLNAILQGCNSITSTTDSIYQSSITKKAAHLDNLITRLVDRAREVVGKKHVENLQLVKSDLYNIIASGSKGDLSHIIQNSGLLGQQLSSDSNRSTHERLHELVTKGLEAKGFVTESFVDGLKPVSFFLHLCSSRMGLVGTAVLTADTGYLSRKTTKALEDLRVCFDNSIRRALGRVVMCRFGWSTNILRVCPIPCIKLSSEELVASYTVQQRAENHNTGGISNQDEVQHLASLHHNLLVLRLYDTVVLMPVAFVEINNEAVQGWGLKRNITTGPSEPLARWGRYRAAVRQLWYDLVRDFWIPDTYQTKTCFFDCLSTATLQTAGVTTVAQLERILKHVSIAMVSNVAQPDEPAGIMAAQSIVAPLTQSNLDSPHHSGESSSIITGVRRIKEILNFTKFIKTPSMTLFIKPSVDVTKIKIIELLLKQCFTGWTTSSTPNARMSQWTTAYNIPDTVNRKWVILRLDKHLLQNHSISPRVVAEFLLSHVARYTPKASKIPDVEAFQPNPIITRLDTFERKCQDHLHDKHVQHENYEDIRVDDVDIVDLDEDNDIDQDGEDVEEETSDMFVNAECDSVKIEPEEEDEDQDIVVDGSRSTTGSVSPEDISFSDLSDVDWWVAIKFDRFLRPPETEHTFLRPIIHSLYRSTSLVCGIKKIKGFHVSKATVNVLVKGRVEQQTVDTIITNGSNLEGVLMTGFFDNTQSFTNDLHETYTQLGVDAVVVSIQEQLLKNMGKDLITACTQHVRLVAHAMCSTGIPCALSYSGMSSTSSNLKLATVHIYL